MNSCTWNVVIYSKISFIHTVLLYYQLPYKSLIFHISMKPFNTLNLPKCNSKLLRSNSKIIYVSALKCHFFYKAAFALSLALCKRMDAIKSNSILSPYNFERFRYELSELCYINRWKIHVVISVLKRWKLALRRKFVECAAFWMYVICTHSEFGR